MRIAIILVVAIGLFGCRTLSSGLSEDQNMLSSEEAADEFIELFRLALATKDYKEYLYNFDTEEITPADDSKELDRKLKQVEEFSKSMESITSPDFVLALRDKLTTAEKLEFFRMVRSEGSVYSDTTSFYDVLSASVAGIEIDAARQIIAETEVRKILVVLKDGENKDIDYIVNTLALLVMERPLMVKAVATQVGFSEFFDQGEIIAKTVATIAQDLPYEESVGQLRAAIEEEVKHILLQSSRTNRPNMAIHTSGSTHNSYFTAICVSSELMEYTLQSRGTVRRVRKRGVQLVNTEEFEADSILGDIQMKCGDNRYLLTTEKLTHDVPAVANLDKTDLQFPLTTVTSIRPLEDEELVPLSISAQLAFLATKGFVPRSFEIVNQALQAYQADIGKAQLFMPRWGDSEGDLLYESGAISTFSNKSIRIEASKWTKQGRIDLTVYTPIIPDYESQDNFSMRQLTAMFCDQTGSEAAGRKVIISSGVSSEDQFRVVYESFFRANAARQGKLPLPLMANISLRPAGAQSHVASGLIELDQRLRHLTQLQTTPSLEEIKQAIMNAPKTHNPGLVFSFLDRAVISYAKAKAELKAKAEAEAETEYGDLTYTEGVPEEAEYENYEAYGEIEEDEIGMQCIADHRSIANGELGGYRIILRDVLQGTTQTY